MPDSRPLWFGVAAIILGVWSWHAKTLNPGVRAVMTLTAVVLAVVYCFWLIDMLVYLMGRVRAAYYFPTIRQLELISRMTEPQLAAIGIGTVQVTKLPVNGRLSVRYRVAGLTDDMAQETVREWLDYCFAWPRFPDLPALHGFNDNQERAELRAFTELAVALNLADPAGANSPARWKVGADEIERTLEV